jgi:hypothetical protein
MPLTQPAGQAQVDFGEAVVLLKGSKRSAAGNVEDCHDGR